MLRRPRLPLLKDIRRQLLGDGVCMKCVLSGLQSLDHLGFASHLSVDLVERNAKHARGRCRVNVNAGVERFVLVSTDKAVRPTSVMGETKRLAELAVGEMARRTGRAFVAVRFGNVLGSSGSVVPLFQRQLQEGVPLTVTDPEATRFFMTIPEAARLILQAALIGSAGDLFVLDMGEAIKVIDLARDLARLAGRDPASIPIEFIGLRPGEKLHEHLFYEAESISSTTHPKVMRARRSGGELEHLQDELEALLAVARTGDHPAARLALGSTLQRLDPAELPLAS